MEVFDNEAIAIRTKKNNNLRFKKNSLIVFTAERIAGFFFSMPKNTTNERDIVKKGTHSP